MKLSESKSDTPNLTTHRNSVKPSGYEGSILHRIPDLDLPGMEIDSEYNIERMIAEGCFARILLVNHRPTNTQVVLKAVHVELTSLREFIKEYHYSYQLSHHPNILSAYQVAFQASDYYVFAQEFAPYGKLSIHCLCHDQQYYTCKFNKMHSSDIILQWFFFFFLVYR